MTGEAWRGQEVFQRIIWTLKEARKKQKREMPWRNGRWTREGTGSQGVPPVVLLLPVPPGSKSPWDSLPPRLSSGLRRCSKCFQASDQVAPPPCPRPVSTKESGAARLLLPVHRFLYLFPFTVSYYKHPFLKPSIRDRENAEHPLQVLDLHFCPGSSWANTHSPQHSDKLGSEKM